MNLRCLLLVLVLSLSVNACAPNAEALATLNPSTATPNPDLAMQDCPTGTGLPAGAQCGVLRVYENPARTGRKIPLAFLRLPAQNQSTGPDATFLLAGGPGQSAIQAFLPLLSALDPLRQSRDVVILDQRGTGSSNALNCPPEDASGSDGPASPSATQTRLLACLQSLDSDPRFYTTAQAAADLEAVRQALDYTQVNLVGVSYGTRLALEYMRLYPTSTRSLVLDGVAPMGWLLGPSAPGDAASALNKIFARCQSEAACHQAFPNLSGEFDALVAAIEKQPAQLTIPDPSSGVPIQLRFDRDRLAQTILTLSYAQETAVLLPLLIHTAYATQDFTPLAAQYEIINHTLEQGVAEGLYLSVVCAEDVPFFPTTQPEPSYLPDQTPDLMNRCSVWPHDPAPAQFLEPVHSDKPVLLISGEADPITPPANAALAAQTLTNTLQITLPGMGHNNLYRGCLPRLTAAFIAQLSTKIDPSCAKEIQPMPFFTNFTGPA